MLVFNKVCSSILLLSVFCLPVFAEPTKDITDVVSAEEFALYKDVGEFILHSPKVTIMVHPEQSDIQQYGKGVMKSLTGSDCDRDGKMDDNATCNAVYVKLWLKYRR